MQAPHTLPTFARLLERSGHCHSPVVLQAKKDRERDSPKGGTPDTANHAASLDLGMKISVPSAEHTT